MTNFFAQTNPAIRRAYEQFTRDVTIYSYSWDDGAGSNDYADGDWTESSETARATFRRASEPTQATGPDGSDVVIDTRVYLDPTKVTATISTGYADETRATEFIDSATGTRYRALFIHDEDSLLEIECERL